MRALKIVAALFMMAACVVADSPWKIVEDWTLQLPNGGLQVFPAYASVPNLYAATTSDGTVVGVNTTTRAIQWQNSFSSVNFLLALQSQNAILVASNDKTTVIDAESGTFIWQNNTIKMSPNLAESYNTLSFGNTVVYRDQSNGFVRLCAVDALTGNQKWCDNRRILGSPDASPNNTLTAEFFDENGKSYSACISAEDGKEIWVAAVDRIFTGSYNWVAVQNGTSLTIVNTADGLAKSSRSVAGLSIGTAVFVNVNTFVFSDNNNWIAAMDCLSGKLIWNVTAPNMDPSRLMQLQHRGEDILVVAVLSFTHTNFTRLSATTGDTQWTVVAKPTGMSLAPVHAWLGNDILYVRNTDNRWSAWGAISGQEISSGTGDLFLPRSVADSFVRSHFSYYVTTNAGRVIDLRIERK